jgi:ABC-type multidrug transport system fused ATPase/permease subunit
MALLFSTLGVAAFAGFAALLLLLALQTFCGIYLQGVRKKVQQHTDGRVAGICDALGGMRTLKMMVAEYTMQSFIGEARASEISASMHWSFIQATVAGVYAVAAPVVSNIVHFINTPFPFFPFMLPLPLCRWRLLPPAGLSTNAATWYSSDLTSSPDQKSCLPMSYLQPSVCSPSSMCPCRIFQHT